MTDINKIKLGFSPLTESIYLYRHGKDERVALEKREAEIDIFRVITEYMMYNAPKGSRKVFSFGESSYELILRPCAAPRSES